MVAECDVLLYANSAKGREVDPIVLLVVDVHPKILLQDLVDPFSLAVGLSWAVSFASLGIKANSCKSDHQRETDGQTEWVNQVWSKYLWVYINYQQTIGSTSLPLAEFAYNNTSHSATMVTPFFANKGFNPKLEVSLEPVVSDTAHQVATDLKELHLYLRDQISCCP